MSSSLTRLLQQAEKALAADNAVAAQSSCEKALKIAPRNPDALFLHGIALLAQERPSEAAGSFEKALAIDPRHGAALEHLGLAALMLGQFGRAEEALRKASVLNGAPATVFMRLGLALLEQERPEAAVAPLRRAVQLEARDPDCRINLGRALALTGAHDEATACFLEAMRLSPRHPDAPFNLGVLSMRRDDHAEARRWFEEALRVAPASIDVRLNLAIVLQRQSEFELAAQHLRQALAIEPKNVAAACELARTYAMQGRTEHARHQYTSTLQFAPDSADAHEGLVSLCLAVGRTHEAIDHLKTLQRLQPGNAAVVAMLANVLFTAGMLDDAFAAAEQALRTDASSASAYGTLANIHLVRGDIERALTVLDAGYGTTKSPELLGMLTFQLRQTCQWDRWRDAWDRMNDLLSEDVQLGSPFWLLCEPTSPTEQLRYARSWSRRRFAGITTMQEAPRRNTSKRLRIGYLSADLQEHATAYLMAEVFERHDRAHFEIFAYSYGRDDGSPMRRRLQSSIEHFVDIAHEPDDIAAERIRADEVDLLVDLKGYTLGDRLGIMARRPCAIQATWLGYPGTTGVDFIDYLIADPVVVPSDAEAHYSERIVRLPVCYQPNDRARAIAQPLSRSEYGLPADAFVYGCFNQSYKLSPEIFALWMRLLAVVPEAVLWLLESNPLATAHLQRFAESHGVDPGRLVFAPRLPLAQHLARYRVTDLALDTFPYTSHTTMSDALWCGCPSIGLCGETFASRVSASLLSAAAMPDLITTTLNEYEALALRLVRSQDRLREMRKRVEEARESSPLFDSSAFTRALEALLFEMVDRH